MTKFYDASIRPPKGSWHFPIGGITLEAHSESQIIEEIAKWQRNNGKFQSTAQIEEMIWEYYCRRQPERCPGVVSTPLSSVSIFTNVVPIEITPELQGPPIWKFLNTLAAQWNPSLHRYFLETLDVIVVVLVCPICRDHWRELLVKKPPTNLQTRFAVCQWVNWAHNEVNAIKNKEFYPYERMVAEFGAPLP